MNLRNILKTFACLLLLSGPALADAVSVDALASGGATMRDNQLREIRDVLRGGRGGYVDLGFNYIPAVTQTPLKSEYGEHDGFAFRHHMAGFDSETLKLVLRKKTAQVHEILGADVPDELIHKNDLVVF